MSKGQDDGAMQPTTGSMFEAFRTAHPEYSPNPAWWWSGDALEPDRLKRQLELYRDGGIWNLVIINLAPTGPLYGHFADDPPFMSDRWWDMFRAVCAHARRLGMKIWFYDQIGFSGANIQGTLIASNPGFIGQTINRAVTTGEGSLTVACPEDATPLFATIRPLDDHGEPTGSPHHVPIAGRTARFSSEGRARLSLVYSSPHGFDYFNVDAGAALIDAIHGAFERHAGEFFEDVIAGTFQDEMPPMPRWSSTFAATFEDMHGYDVVPRLDGLWERLGGEEERIRRDYHATRAVLAERGIFKPLFDWHDARDMTCGVDQQNPARAGDPEGGVRLYADYMKMHRWYNAPGCDHHGEAKIHSSLAHLYGRDRVWLEAFHTSGWGGTIEETFDWLVPWLRGGVTLYSPHATYYGTRGGWFEWAPPSTDWRQPYWAHYRTFADAVARLQWLLSQGAHRCNVGVVYPTVTIQAGLGLDGAISDEARAAHECYLTLTGRMVWFNQHTGLLDAVGVDYDVLDDESIGSARTDGGLMSIGAESYRTILLPSCTVLDREVAKALVAFAESGGEVVVIGSRPSRLAGNTTDPDRLLERLASCSIETDEARLGNWLVRDNMLVRAPVPTLVRQVGHRTIVFVPGAFPGASKVAGWPIATVDFDRSTYPEEMTIQVDGVSGAPELWNPFSATRETVPGTRWRHAGNGVEVDIPFDGAPCVVLVWDAGSEAPIAPDLAAARVVVSIEGAWDVEIVPTMDNRWGDFTYPASNQVMPVQQWSFQPPESDDIVVATFGPRARWVGPDDPDALLDIRSDADWKTASWSLSRGIHKDGLHHFRLGPAGHVAEEFLDFGDVSAGDAVRIRTSFKLNAGERPEWLVIGAPASKRAWIDGTELSIDDAENSRYQTAIKVDLEPGLHTLDLLLTADEDVRLRGWLALVAELRAFQRPDRLKVAGSSKLGTAARFELAFVVDGEVRSGHLQIETRGPARVILNTREIGRQGGYLPYGDGSSTQRYDITDILTPGDHVLSVIIDDTGVPIRLVVDGVVTFEDDTPDLWLMSDRSWSVTRDSAPETLLIEARPVGDPQLSHLRQRPHPLPGSAWLEGPMADPGTVHPTVWHIAGASGREHLRCLVPPGATEATIPIAGHASATLDGNPLGESGESPGTAWTVPLPGADRATRLLDLEIATVPGFAEGATLTGPITYSVGPGRMELGNWTERGLFDYSGIVCYRREIFTPELADEERIWLDLGHIRGSAAVRIDGVEAGTLVVAPFRVEITDHVRRAAETLTIEIDVASTLAPYLDATSPTPFVLSGQTVSGLYGPVQLVAIPSSG